MNIAILNGWFAVVFGGPLLFGVVAAGSRLSEPEDLGWVALAVALYVVHAARHRDRERAVEQPARQHRARRGRTRLFERRWVRWNAVRTVVCTLSFGALVAAALS